MRGALVVLAAALTACATTPPAPPPEPEPLILLRAPEVHVSPEGNDTWTGAPEAPLRSLAFALDHTSATAIHLAAGDYDDHTPELVVRRDVRLEGPDDGAAVVKSRLHVRRGALTARQVELAQGLSVDPGASLGLDHVTAGAGANEHTLLLDGARALVVDSQLGCGAETCVEAKSSTVTLRRTQLESSATGKRALRAETSSVTTDAVRVSGSSINQVLALRGTRLTVRESRFDGAGGSALAALQGARLDADQVTISNAAKMGVLVESARASLRRVLVQPTKGFGLGIAGAEVQVAGCTFDASTDGVASIGAHAGKASNVRMIDSLVRHAKRPGILLAEGDLTLEGMRFVGDTSGRGEGGDAILANGTDAILTVKSALIESPSGFGISLTNGAQGTITATITRPREGGIYIESVLGVPVLIRGSRVEGCGSGTGIVVHDATEVRIEDVTVTECPEAGILAGQGAAVQLTRAKLTKNGRYGVAAFGGSTVEVSGTRASGGKWVTFATCGDGARIEDLGDNKLVGQVSVCP